MYTQTLFLMVCFASGVLSHSLFSPCKVTDIDCITKSAEAAIPAVIAGIPELGVESSDPLFIEKIEGNLSIIKYTFYKTTVEGYKQCKVSNIKISPELTTLHYELDCDKLKLSGKYDVDGRLVILPVKGTGDYELITGKYHIDIDAELNILNKNGKDHLHIKSFKLKCKSLSPTKYDFKNLFNGQKDLSDAVHKFAHENWQEVAELVQDPTWYATQKKVISNVNKFLKSVPLEDLKID